MSGTDPWFQVVPLWPHMEEWAPQIAGWYRQNRWGKARLAP